MARTLSSADQDAKSLSGQSRQSIGSNQSPGLPVAERLQLFWPFPPRCRFEILFFFWTKPLRDPRIRRLLLDFNLSPLGVHPTQSPRWLSTGALEDVRNSRSPRAIVLQWKYVASEPMHSFLLQCYMRD